MRKNREKACGGGKLANDGAKMHISSVAFKVL